MEIHKLEQAYQIAAKIVATYGDIYLPVFERLHHEVERLNQTERIKTIALRVASTASNKSDIK